MVKYREIIRLKCLGISMRGIADSCGCSLGTVSSVLSRAKGFNLQWPLPEELDDAAIREILYPPRPKNENRYPLDCERISKELERKGVTRSLLWGEYCDEALNAGREPYQYSQFCRILNRWAKDNQLTMHLEHKPGKEMQVDWVGTTLRVVDPDTGEQRKVYLFIACLPYSSYIYVEGFLSTDLESWVTAHTHAFEALGGSAPILVPDNLKTGVTKHTRDEIVLNEVYRRMAEHYNCAIVPARVRKPQDKAAVEMNVRVVTNRVIAPLRDKVFFELGKLNRRIKKLVEGINERPFQKREGSRKSVYLAKEKQLLNPLPKTAFEFYASKRLTVQFNYHVCFEGVYYSVPHIYRAKEVDIKATRNTVGIYYQAKRIALHRRDKLSKGAYVTDPEHMPETHRDYLAWNEERFRQWAHERGGATEEVMIKILESKSNIKRNYRPCRLVVALSEKYGASLLEEACKKANAANPRPSYKTVHTIIKTLHSKRKDPNEHAYLRGAHYYDD